MFGYLDSVCRAASGCDSLCRILDVSFFRRMEGKGVKKSDEFLPLVNAATARRRSVGSHQNASRWSILNLVEDL